MKKLLASLRTMLLLPLLALGVAPASAQTSLEPVPALADIKSQEELAKAVAVLDAALLIPTTGAIWRSLPRSSRRMWNSTTIKAA